MKLGTFIKQFDAFFFKKVELVDVKNKSEKVKLDLFLLQDAASENNLEFIHNLIDTESDVMTATELLDIVEGIAKCNKYVNRDLYTGYGDSDITNNVSFYNTVDGETVLVIHIF